MTKSEKLEKVEKHLNWIAFDVFPNDQKRAIEQCYGFIQGVTFFDDTIWEDVTEMWEDFRFKVLYGGNNNEKNNF